MNSHHIHDTKDSSRSLSLPLCRAIEDFTIVLPRSKMGHKTMGYPRISDPQTEVVSDLISSSSPSSCCCSCYVIGISFLRAHCNDLSLLFWFLLIFRTMRGIVLETNNIVDSHFIAQGLKQQQ